MKVGDIVQFIYADMPDIGVILEFKTIYSGSLLALVLFSNPERLKWLDLRDLNGVIND